PLSSRPSFPTRRSSDLYTPGNVHKHWRNLRAYFNWLIREGDRKAAHPMKNVLAPHVPDKPSAVFTDDELHALLKACGGQSFVDRDRKSTRLNSSHVKIS